MINPQKFRKSAEADIISLEEIGFTASRTDYQIAWYIKRYVRKNYEENIDEKTALIISMIIKDLLLELQEDGSK